MTEPSPTVAELLKEIARGSREAEAALIPLVYDELRRIARRFMRREGGRNTLQTTALVHEAYLRLAGIQEPDWHGRSHFFAVAATVMRRILVDRARARRAEKRGGGALVPFDDNTPAAVDLDEPDRILAVDEALTRLAQLDPRQARIVELRFFAGMTVEETAEALDVSSRTVKREWQLARVWLFGELRP